MLKQTFIPKTKYPKHTKAQLRKIFPGMRYSGKTFINDKGIIENEPGFYVNI